jgi:glucose-6-phosphate 1-dehydrogenase
MADRTTFVLFGATGDLARTKLWPALHDLASDDRLPQDLTVLGISRSASTERLRALADEHGRHGRLATGDAWERIVGSIHAVNGAGDDPELYERLERELAERPGDRLTYLSVAPSLFGPIADRLGEIGLGREAADHSRMVIEKPFGTDLASARALHERLHRHFEEHQIIRIDHYLGKETVQNLMVLRFVNGIFEPLWDRSAVEHVQITVAEEGGVGGRGEFYDATGALRDVGQNHLLQLLALTAMDPPGRVTGDELRQERLKVLRSLVPLQPADAVLGQYEGYDAEDGVAEGSRTDTYVALRAHIESWRWAGVPFYLRTGKRLSAKAAEIAVTFKPAPHLSFQGDGVHPSPNRLVIGIQPGQRVSLHVSGKRPGTGLEVVDVALDFEACRVEEEAPEAYERLLGDAFVGQLTLFASSDEIEAQWAAIQPLLDQRPDPVTYEPGSDGPTEAGALIARDGLAWRPLPAVAGTLRG